MLKQPLAYLLLSNLPNQNRLKNLKYYLALGDNVIGADSRCQIAIPSRYVSQRHIANIALTQHTLVLETFLEDYVRVEGNLRRDSPKHRVKEQFVSLAIGVKYMPRLNEYFYLGTIRAIIVVASGQELTMIKGVVNRSTFLLTHLNEGANLVENAADGDQNIIGEIGQDIKGDFGSMLLEQPQFLSGNRRDQSQATGCTADLAIDHTRESYGQAQADGGNVYEATLIIQDNLYAYEPTLDLNNDFAADLSYHPTHTVQSRNHQSLLREFLSSQSQQADKNHKLWYPLEPNYTVTNSEYCPVTNMQSMDCSNIQNIHCSNIQNMHCFKTQNIHCSNTQNISNIKQSQPKVQMNVAESHPQQFSQQILLQQIRQNCQTQPRNEEEIQFSMPDTIIDNNENPQAQPKEAMPNADASVDMPDTIQPQQDPSGNNIQSAPAGNVVHPRVKYSQTMKEQSIAIPLNSKAYKSHKEFSVAEGVSSEEKPIEDFEGLFGEDEEKDAKKTWKYQENKFGKKTSTNVFAESSNEFNVSSIVPSLPTNPARTYQSSMQQEAIHKSEDLPNSKKLINVCNFKPTPTHRSILSSQGYSIVAQPQDDYDILIVKQPIKITNKLLLALVNGKQIENDQWIFNKNSRISSKINGHLWQHVYQLKGQLSKLFNGRFYISKRAQQVLQGVVELCGGEQVDKLDNKRKALNVVLKIQDGNDMEIYLQNCAAKKWLFVRYEAIIDSVLAGKSLLSDEKYKIDVGLD